MKNIRFIESYTFGADPPKVDREKGVIQGVKFLGWESKNEGSTRAYEHPDPKIFVNAKSRVNHYMQEGDENPPDPRVEDIWAFVESAEVRTDGVYGTMKYNPKHPKIEQILWWAENNPKVAGFSPIMFGTETKVGGRTVRTPLMVESVDLVDRPATTGGFFESHRPKENKDMDLTEALVKVAELERANAALTAQSGELTKSLESEKKEHAATKGSLVAMTEAQRKAASDVSRVTLAKKELGDDVGPAFLEALKALPSDEAAKQTIEAVKVARGQPISSGTTPGDAAGAGGKFVESLDDPKAKELIALASS